MNTWLRPRHLVMLGGGALLIAVIAMLSTAILEPSLSETPWWQVVRLLFIAGFVLLGMSAVQAVQQRRYLQRMRGTEAQEGDQSEE